VRRQIFGAALTALALTVAISLPASATAARKIATGISDPLAGISSSHDPRWYQATSQANATYVRLNVDWARIAPTPPAHPNDPADPAYRFDETDAAVAGAIGAHLIPVLTLYDAPRWAEGKPIPPHLPADYAGGWKPNVAQFGHFAHAVAARYSGHFPNLCGLPLTPPCLPRVSYYEIWNEPNLSTFLAPQWKRVGKRHKRYVPASPARYAGLLNAAYDEIKAAAPGASVLGGATAPKGVIKPGGTRIPPVTFLRSFFCIDGAEGCGPKPKLDIISAHPIDRTTSPIKDAPARVDVYIPNLGRITRLVAEAQRTGHVSGPAKIPLWVTEFWWETDPPDKALGVSPRKQAAWVSQALRLFFKQHVAVAFNFLIRDESYPDFVDGRDKSYQSGLYFHSGKRKPAAKAFAFPFAATRAASGRVAVWGSSPRAGEVAIQRRAGGRWETVRSLSLERPGVFRARLRIRDGGELRARIGTTASARAKVGR
jgi:hypothetical protein